MLCMPIKTRSGRSPDRATVTIPPSHSHTLSPSHPHPMSPRHFADALCALVLASGFATALAADTDPKTRLAVRDSQFLLDDRPVFMLGCSYYGALGADEKSWKADLD